MLRELFREHYDLADRFEAAAQQISAVERSLHSTEGQQGIAELLLDAADQCRAAAGTLGNLNLDALAYSVATLNQRVNQIPERLLKTTDDVQFRAALRSAIANEVTDAVAIAREQAIECGVDLAVEGIAAAVKREIDKIRVHDLFTKPRLVADLARYKKAYAELDGSFAAEREKHARLYADQLASASRWGVRRMVAALILGIVIGLAHLAPMIEEKLHPDLMLKPVQSR